MNFFKEDNFSVGTGIKWYDERGKKSLEETTFCIDSFKDFFC